MISEPITESLKRTMTTNHRRKTKNEVVVPRTSRKVVHACRYDQWHAHFKKWTFESVTIAPLSDGDVTFLLRDEVRVMEKNKGAQFENIHRHEINTNDSGTLAIDLGSSTTVVVFQKENGQPPELLDLPPISRAPGEIPSLIWKSSEEEEDYFIGQQIIDLNLINEEAGNNLAQDFKRWIGSPEIDPVYESKISPDKAGEILIHKIWEKVSAQVNVKRLVLTAVSYTHLTLPTKA